VLVARFPKQTNATTQRIMVVRPYKSKYSAKYIRNTLLSR